MRGKQDSLRRLPRCRAPLPHFPGAPGRSPRPLRRKRKCVSVGSWRRLPTCRTRSCWRSSLTSRSGTGSASPGGEGPGGGRSRSCGPGPRGAGVVLTAVPSPRVCHRWKRLVDDRWLWRHVDLTLYTVRGAGLGRGRVALNRGPPLSRWTWSRQSRVRPGRVAYLLLRHLPASVSPSSKWGNRDSAGSGRW